MSTPEEQIAALTRRVAELEAEVAKLRPVADAAKRWYLDDRTVGEGVQGGATERLHTAIKKLIRDEGAGDAVPESVRRQQRRK